MIHESCIVLIMNGKDILVLLKILCVGTRMPYQDLAKELGMSVGAVHQAVRRGVSSGLLTADHGTIPHAMEEWLLYGVRYFIPLVRGGRGRGMPTGLSAAPFTEWFPEHAEDVWVWPDPEGTLRGDLIQPIFSSVPFAARQDPELHAWLAVLDVLRGGRARERNLATQWVKERLSRVAG